jgi:hypothetical protein
MSENLISIKRVSFQLYLPSAEGASDLQDAISAFFYSTLLRELELLLGQYNSADIYWRIDTLNLDLGEINTHFSEQELAQRISAALKKELDKLAADKPSNGQDADNLNSDWENDMPYKQRDRVGGKKLPQQWTMYHFALQTLAYFLEKGFFPWHYNGNLGDLQVYLSQNIAETATLIGQLSAQNKGLAQRVSKRLSQQFDSHIIQSLWQYYYPTQSDDLSRLQSDFVQYCEQSQQAFQQKEWHYLLLENALVQRNERIFLPALFRQMAVELANNSQTSLDIWVAQLHHYLFDRATTSTETIAAAPNLSGSSHSADLSEQSTNWDNRVGERWLGDGANAEISTATRQYMGFSEVFLSETQVFNAELNREKTLFSDQHIIEQNLKPTLRKLREVFRHSTWRPDFTTINALIAQLSEAIAAMLLYAEQKPHLIGVNIGTESDNTAMAKSEYGALLDNWLAELLDMIFEMETEQVADTDSTATEIVTIGKAANEASAKPALAADSQNKSQIVPINLAEIEQQKMDNDPKTSNDELDNENSNAINEATNHDLINQLQGDISEKQGDITINKDKTGQFQGNLTINQSEITQLQNELTINQGDISEKQDDLTINKGEITQLQNELTINQGDISEKQSDIHINKDEITQLQNELTISQGDISEKQSDIHINKDETGLLQGDLTINQSDISKEQDDITINKSEIVLGETAKGYSENITEKTANNDALNIAAENDSAINAPTNLPQNKRLDRLKLPRSKDIGSGKLAADKPINEGISEISIGDDIAPFAINMIEQLAHYSHILTQWAAQIAPLYLPSKTAIWGDALEKLSDLLREISYNELPYTANEASFAPQRDAINIAQTHVYSLKQDLTNDISGEQFTENVQNKTNNLLETLAALELNVLINEAQHKQLRNIVAIIRAVAVYDMEQMAIQIKQFNTELSQLNDSEQWLQIEGHIRQIFKYYLPQMQRMAMQWQENELRQSDISTAITVDNLSKTYNNEEELNWLNENNKIDIYDIQQLQADWRRKMDKLKEALAKLDKNAGATEQIMRDMSQIATQLEGEKYAENWTVTKQDKPQSRVGEQHQQSDAGIDPTDDRQSDKQNNAELITTTALDSDKQRTENEAENLPDAQSTFKNATQGDDEKTSEKLTLIDAANEQDNAKIEKMSLQSDDLELMPTKESAETSHIADEQTIWTSKNRRLSKTIEQKEQGEKIKRIKKMIADQQKAIADKEALPDTKKQARELDNEPSASEIWAFMDKQMGIIQENLPHLGQEPDRFAPILQAYRQIFGLFLANTTLIWQVFQYDKTQLQYLIKQLEQMPAWENDIAINKRSESNNNIVNENIDRQEIQITADELQKNIAEIAENIHFSTQKTDFAQINQQLNTLYQITDHIQQNLNESLNTPLSDKNTMPEKASNALQIAEQLQNALQQLNDKVKRAAQQKGQKQAPNKTNNEPTTDNDALNPLEQAGDSENRTAVYEAKENNSTDKEPSNEANDADAQSNAANIDQSERTTKPPTESENVGEKDAPSSENISAYLKNAAYQTLNLLRSILDKIGISIEKSAQMSETKKTEQAEITQTSHETVQEKTALLDSEKQATTSTPTINETITHTPEQEQLQSQNDQPITSALQTKNEQNEANTSDITPTKQTKQSDKTPQSENVFNKEESEKKRYDRYKKTWQNNSGFEQQWHNYLQLFQKTDKGIVYPSQYDSVPYKPFGDEDEDEAEAIYIQNAGLILLWVYLGYFFKDLQLLEQGKFIDAQAQHRAAHILQYVATAQENSDESALVLNKILCGMPIDEPLEQDIILTGKEKEASEKLINSAIKNWSALKSTSVEGYREAFIRREGKLIYTQEGWKLIVAPKTYDVLLNYLPYGISLIRQAWMDDNLWVEWV